VIIYLDIIFKRLEKEKKNYSWPRIRHCPKCGRKKVWGHGYVERFFDGWENPLWIKRYRCNECGAVHTVRPKKHWRGFWASSKTIIASLMKKLDEGRWLAMINRQRQQYWWKGFQKQRALEGLSLEASVESLQQLLKRSIIVSTHSRKYREIRTTLDPPYLIYAVTPEVGCE